MSYFEGRRVLLTGGSSGIGLAAAKMLHAQGAELILVARDEAKLDAAAEQVRCSNGPSVKTLSLDIGDRDAVRNILKSLDDPINVLINNAGITRPGNFLELPEDCFQEMLDVNYLGAVNLTRVLLPAMVERKEGRVAFVSSLLGQMGIWGYSAYAASKFAIRGFAECLRSELKPYNIPVTVCYPPDTDTPQHEWEQPYLPLETKAQAGNAGLLTAEYVAEKLLQGIAKGKFEVIPGGEAKFAAYMNRLAPSIVQATLDRDARKAREKL